MTKKRAIFLDRDGVINKKAKEHDYIKNWSEFEFLPHVANAISQLNEKFLVVVISNQGGISRKMMTVNDVNSIHSNMQLELKKNNAIIDKVYFCPHYVQDNCMCRKPQPGLILQAQKELNIDLPSSYMIGDNLIDIEAGKKAGCKTILLGDATAVQKVKPDFIARTILEIPNFIG